MGLCTLTSGRIYMIGPLARFLPVRLTMRRPGGRRLEGSTNRSHADNQSMICVMDANILYYQPGKVRDGLCHDWLALIVFIYQLYERGFENFVLVEHGNRRLTVEKSCTEKKANIKNKKLSVRGRNHTHRFLSDLSLPLRRVFKSFAQAHLSLGQQYPDNTAARCQAPP